MMHGRMLVLLLVCTSILRAGDLLDSADAHYSDGRFRSAAKLYTKALAAGENPAAACYNRGNAWYQLEEYPRAISSYRRAIWEAPAFFNAYLNLGILYYTKEDYPAAAAVLERARRVAPEKDSLCISVLGAVYYEMEVYEKAIPLFVRLTEQGRPDSRVYYMLYDMHRTLGDRERAAFWIQAYPDSTDALFREKYSILADLALQRGDTERGMYYLEMLVRRGGAPRWIYYRYVKTLSENGSPHTALMKSREFLSFYPDFTQLAVTAGNIAFEESLYEDAAFFYRKAFQAGSAAGGAGLQNVIAAYGRLGREKRAAELGKIID
ncbi:MAG: tetratricopeptide repeat protein [Fibrobacterota bacterium]